MTLGNIPHEPHLPSSACDFHRGMIDDFPTPVWISDTTAKIIYVNRAWVEFTGCPIESQVGHGWLECVHPEDRDSVAERCHKHLRTRQPSEVEFRVRRNDGVFRWVVERGNPLHRPDGTFTGFIGFCYDTTERRTMDSARREIEEQARLLGLATRDMVWSWDRRTDRAINNASFAATLGDLPGPFGASVAWWKARVHPDDAERVLAALGRTLEEGSTDAAEEHRFRKLDGSFATLEVRVCLEWDVNGELVRVLGAMRDITQRKRAEQAQARLTRMLEATSDFVGMADILGNVFYINRAGRRMLGWPVEGPLGPCTLQDIHPDWATAIVMEEAFPNAIREGIWTGETALRGTEGCEIPVSQILIAHSAADGTPEFMSTMMRDIGEQKRADVARIEWANRYDAAIRASGQLLFDWNTASNDITYGGDSEGILGFTMKEMAGGLPRLRELIVPDDRAAFDEEIARATATRDPFHLALRLRRKDEGVVPIEAKGYFFLDRQGRSGRMVGFLADVTEQQRAQEELARAHDSLEARVIERTAELAHSHIVIRDRAMQQETVAHLGQQALAGAKLEELFDEATALVRTTLKVDLCSVLERGPAGSELFVRGSAGWPDEMRRGSVPAGYGSQSGYTLLVGEPVIVENLAKETRFQISQPIREIRATSAISVPIHSEGDSFGVLCACSTDLRAFTQDDAHFLQSVANVLTAAITGRRAEESIRLAQEQAEAANRAKSDFLSRMSHELRTPLNAILGFTQLLEIDQPTTSQAESISHISRAGQHLLSLINEVLDIARIEAGRLALSPEPIELSKFLSQAIQLIRPLAVRHKIEIALQANEPEFFYALADRQRLQQVILNLLSNAVKYNRPRGEVTVSCSAFGGERVRISVADTGAGISVENRERLFVPFERLGAESTEIEGTGIGLALSQRIAHAMHGEIGVESIPARGSTFWLELPSAPAAPPHPADAMEPDTAKTFPFREYTVLYVEDQDLNLRLVERILQHRPGFKLLTAMQGRLGLDLAREHRPDLVLLDLNLPDMTGDEILRQLKLDPALQQIPVIMISADAMGERVESLLSMGAADYLTKPYRVADFFRVIEKALAGE